MIAVILIYGAIAGLIATTPMVWGMLTMQGDNLPENGAVIGYIDMIVALTAVFLGIKHHRDKTLGGVIKFLPAFGVGLGISAVAGVLWVIGWELSLALTDFDFAKIYSQAMIDDARKAGASAVDLQKATADGRAFVDMYANPLIRMPITFVEIFPIGAVISLLSALLLRNSRFLPARRLA